MNADADWLCRELDIRRTRSGVQDVDMSDVLDAFQKKARDHGRTPIQVRDIPTRVDLRLMFMFVMV